MNKQEIVDKLKEYGCRIETIDGGVMLDTFFMSDVLLEDFLKLVVINDKVENP